jgi:hypothetical protein
MENPILKAQLQDQKPTIIELFAVVILDQTLWLFFYNFGKISLWRKQNPITQISF